MPRVSLEIDGIGKVPINLDASLGAGKFVEQQASAGVAGRVHRAEPQPPHGSSGPPYALVQFSLSGLSHLPHEGTAHIHRGSVCLIGGTSDIFISLARHGEHDGWESSMTVLGSVPEPELTALVEEKILTLPKHNFTHPTYGTVMSMLDTELPCRLRSA
jgi:hypothetical protein